MQNPPPNRRYLLKALAGMGVLAPLPLWAAPLPTMEEVAFDPDIPALGNPDGNVTVVEYTDYQCPYCKLSYIELSKVMAEDGNIRLVLRDWPIFGQVSRNAALLTLASHSQGRYAEAVKTLMTANERLTFRNTANLLSNAGIDVELARNELGARQDIFVSLLTRTEAQAKAFQLKGTPGFLIGKSLYKRGMTADDFRKAIAQARA
ncbi:thioredoxin domain-containing protein [Aminobacter niigataensis]|uniref:thioredoxin domain-containing protein n=1 Tax=Aminobacter niigataensis TaxID=83265 RepID=UPI0024CBA9A9|nr:thioredoxin domain-containing protein [Aminobacter niigataensis]CAI2935426.1 Protein-disulfide isomerase [Aminobacter niigataensis]